MQPGLRPDGVFLGERDHKGDPAAGIHRRARRKIFADLMSGLLDANDRMREDGLDAVLQAAATAFGFVYIHPFQDGNGRHAPLPDPSRSGRAEIHAARHGVPGFLRHARPHRRLSGDAASALRAAHAIHRLAADAGLATSRS